jgi:hypothetical protein
MAYVFLTTLMTTRVCSLLFYSKFNVILIIEYMII